MRNKFHMGFSATLWTMPEFKSLFCLLSVFFLPLLVPWVIRPVQAQGVVVLAWVWAIEGEWRKVPRSPGGVPHPHLTTVCYSNISAQQNTATCQLTSEWGTCPTNKNRTWHEHSNVCFDNIEPSVFMRHYTQSTRMCIYIGPAAINWQATWSNYSLSARPCVTLIALRKSHTYNNTLQRDRSPSVWAVLDVVDFAVEVEVVENCLLMEVDQQGTAICQLGWGENLNLIAQQVKC